MRITTTDWKAYVNFCWSFTIKSDIIRNMWRRVDFWFEGYASQENLYFLFQISFRRYYHNIILSNAEV